MGSLLGGGLLSLLCEYLIKSSVVLSVSIVLFFLLRKKSAGLRHLVLAVFLIGLLFLPILSSVTAGWETKLLPTWGTNGARQLRIDGLSSNLGSLSDNLEAISPASGETILSDDRDENLQSVSSGFFTALLPVFGFVAAAMWLGGLIFLSIRIGLGLYGTLRWKREGRDIQDSLWKRLLSRFLEAISLRRKIRLLSHEKAIVPLTWGVFRPVVMMPAASRKWSVDQRSAALYHELSHIKRGDFLVMILARISRAVYWFNPLSWIVLGMVKREQEKACDELVLKAGIKPSTYAENLLFIRNSASSRWKPPAAVLGAVSRSQLNDRLTTILKQRFVLKEVQMKTKVLLSFLAILSISFIGLARPGSSFENREDEVFTEMAAVVEPFGDFETSIVEQTQEKKEQKKEVKKDVKKEEQEKKEEKTTVVWTGKSGKKGTYEIILDKDDPKKIIHLVPNVKFHEDSETTWTIEADKLELSDDAEKIKLGEGNFTYINEGDKDGVKVIKLESPHIQIKKVGKDEKRVVVDVGQEVHVVIDSDKYEELIEKIKEKLAKLKEKDLDLEAKEVEVEGIEITLQKLQETLKKKFDKSDHVVVHVSPKYSHSYKISTKDIHLDHGEKISAIGVMDDEGSFSVIYHGELDIDQKGEYERAIKKLESNLPENYSLDSTFDDDEGTLVIRIKKEKKEGEEYKEAVINLDEIKELIEEFKKDLEKIKK
jgi:beta-lactamase regulating signal transducer with metallopeptidase domain